MKGDEVKDGFQMSRRQGRGDRGRVEERKDQDLVCAKTERKNFAKKMKRVTDSVVELED